MESRAAGHKHSTYTEIVSYPTALETVIPVARRAETAEIGSSFSILSHRAYATGKARGLGSIVRQINRRNDRRPR